MNDITDAYLNQRGGTIQAQKIERYRYDKHIKPVIGAKAVSQITVIDIQRIKSNMSDLSPASVWATLELIRRLTNYGERVGALS